MAHPLMFDPEDPLLARVRAIALGLPGAAEKLSHGRPAFYTRKVFAYYSGSCKVDGEWVQHPRSVMLFGDLDGLTVLRSLPDSYIPGYLGGYGWTGPRPRPRHRLGRAGRVRPSLPRPDVGRCVPALVTGPPADRIPASAGMTRRGCRDVNCGDGSQLSSLSADRWRKVN
jgi:hypothetical protein